MKAIALALAALLWAATALSARAEETVFAELAILRGGLVCDTLEEAAGFTDLSDSGDRAEAVSAYPGCGMLARPMAVRILAVGTILTVKGERTLYRYEPVNGAAHQFGVSSPSPRRGA